MLFYNEGVMGNDIQIVADIIFDDGCLLYLCTPGMDVNLPKERASPCLRARRRSQDCFGGGGLKRYGAQA